MLCREIIDVIEGTYPKEAALAWDNVGLLVGRTEKEVKRIYVALDATDEIIEAAIRGNADMLVTHHPLIFSPLKTVTDEHFISNRVVKLLQHDISYYAMHTNYDVLGMAELSGKMMELVQAEPLEVTIPENNQGIRPAHLDDNASAAFLIQYIHRRPLIDPQGLKTSGNTLIHLHARYYIPAADFTLVQLFLHCCLSPFVVAF